MLYSSMNVERVTATADHVIAAGFNESASYFDFKKHPKILAKDRLT